MTNIGNPWVFKAVELGLLLILFIYVYSLSLTLEIKGNRFYFGRLVGKNLFQGDVEKIEVFSVGFSHKLLVILLGKAHFIIFTRLIEPEEIATYFDNKCKKPIKISYLSCMKLLFLKNRLSNKG